MERISRVRVINTVFQSHFGFDAGGRHVRTMPGRRGSYDVFNDTREVPTARFPGKPATTIARQPVGNVPYIIPRTFEMMPIDAETVHNQRRIGGPTGELDIMGQAYVADQERIVKQRITNLREFQTVAMLRGSYTYTVSGDELRHDYTGGSYTVDYQVPAGNKGQLDMLGGGNLIGTAWDNAAAPILDDIREVNAALEQLIGRGVEDIFVTSVVWGFVLNNTQVQAQAGSVNRVFDVLERDPNTQDFVARLFALPWIRWHICDKGLNLAGTFTKLIPDTSAVMLPIIDEQVVSYYEGSEPVSEWEGRPMVDRAGEYYWIAPKANPTRYELFGLHNGLPVLKVPAAIVHATVDF